MNIKQYDNEDKLQEDVIDIFTADDYDGEEIIISIRAEGSDGNCNQWLTFNVCGAETYNLMVAVVSKLRSVYSKITFHMEDK